MKCRSCLTEVPESAERCPACGAPFAPSSVVSLHVDGGRDEESGTGAGGADSAGPRAAASAAGRFAAGALIDGRYRILGPLGSGGMGEVFRAEDERLGTLVALKFLPDSAAHDDVLRRRLLEEVRTARVVTHPNVCRVHDVGEADGKLYLSMELVDGEDLGSLLRRIGRLPGDKAIELARQICAGLAAAHARGILHRDLKPANVMVDGEGRARITDFGLAIAGEASGSDALAGTPLYMAPEQLEGREATVRSDVYALGLVLYELFTGRRPHAGSGVQELLRARRAGETSPASAYLRDIDPSVEGLIERCLEPEPRARPTSALAVAAGLPGADSLESRLAAGETPSPELIAAAGGVGALRPAVAAVLAGLVVALGVVAMWTSSRTQLVGYEDLPLAPEVLEHGARELLVDLGFADDPRDTAFGLGRNGTILGHVAATSEEADRWEALRAIDSPSAVVFWFRQADRWLDPFDRGGAVSFDDPPRTEAGMVTTILSPKGKLVHLEAVAPWWFDEERAGTSVDWDPLFAAAGLDPETHPLEPVEPSAVPGTAYDELHVWETRHPEAPDLPLRVEAAGFQGLPVRFVLAWDPEERPDLPGRRVQSIAQVVEEIAQIVVLFGAIALAGRAWRSGRADRRGALRLGALVFLTLLGAWAASLHAVPDSAYLFDSFFDAASGAAIKGLIAWAMYLALEGFVRRIWPRCLVAWSRLLNGGWRDPMVAHEVLVGVVIGGAALLVRRGAQLAVPALGRPPLEPSSVRWQTLMGLRFVVGDVLLAIPSGLMMGFGVVLILVILRGVLRHRGAAIAVLSAMMLITSPIQETGVKALDWLQALLLTGLFLVVLLRYGVLTLAVAATWLRVALLQPADFDFGSWYGHVGAAFLALTAAVALYGYRCAAPSWAAHARD